MPLAAWLPGFIVGGDDSRALTVTWGTVPSRKAQGSVPAVPAVRATQDERPLAESAHFDEWRAETLPRLVKVLRRTDGILLGYCCHSAMAVQNRTMLLSH